MLFDIMIDVRGGSLTVVRGAGECAGSRKMHFSSRSIWRGVSRYSDGCPPINTGKTRQKHIHAAEPRDTYERRPGWLIIYVSADWLAETSARSGRRGQGAFGISK